ncbi:hypothetical protein DXG01_005928 [Tephrocybe rancida]|nr:hypothetical protein DXG01_005928 [Tephrocybe rancida]
MCLTVLGDAAKAHLQSPLGAPLAPFGELHLQTNTSAANAGLWKFNAIRILVLAFSQPHRSRDPLRPNGWQVGNVEGEYDDDVRLEATVDLPTRWTQVQLEGDMLDLRIEYASHLEDGANFRNVADVVEDIFIRWSPNQAGLPPDAAEEERQYVHDILADTYGPMALTQVRQVRTYFVPKDYI